MLEELRFLSVRLAGKRQKSKRASGMSLQLQIDQIIAANANAALKLQLGCGHNILPGWVNTDTAPIARADYLDIKQPLPFAANMFVAVFCEHTIEHVQKDEARRLFAEIFRILKP